MIVAIIIAMAVVGFAFFLATRSIPVAVVTNPVGYEVTDNDPLEGIAAVGTPIGIFDFEARFVPLVTRGSYEAYKDRGSNPNDAVAVPRFRL